MYSVLILAAICAAPTSAHASPLAGTLAGKVTDPAGAAMPGVRVRVENPVTGFERSVETGPDGSYQLLGIPFNRYHVTARRDGFAPWERDVEIRGPVAVNLPIGLALEGQPVRVEVHGYAADVIENVPHAHYDADRASFARLPSVNPGAGLSDAVTMSVPGVVANSNGFFHALGDHAQASFIVDGQPVTDQQSKQFSTQLPPNAVQAMELVTGGAAAEFGDKTSLVINTRTPSGLDAAEPHGSFAAQYGSFGTASTENAIGFGTKDRRIGNFLAANAVRSGRFLDTPEFRPFHAIGNGQTIFNRFDFRPNGQHSFHLNVLGARNWFQIPNTLDQPDQDQRQRATTLSLNGGHAWVAGPRTVVNSNLWMRQDRVNYYPSREFTNDTPATIASNRHLTNWGARADVSAVRGRHSLKTGVLLTQTRLRENFSLGITSEELAEGDEFLERYLVTEGGQPFRFAAKGNVNQFAAYVQDSITAGDWTFTGGLRLDHYDGPAAATRLQPRAGVSYRVRPTGTVLRFAYSNTLESPYNENLLLSSTTGVGGLGGGNLGASVQPIQPGHRNQFNAGIQQGVGRWLQIDADYFWKRTTNAFDFGALFDTPIFFPLSLPKSKIDGVAVRIATTDLKGFRAMTLMGHSRARFQGPANGGLLFNDDLEEGTFRIDHDQAFQQTTFLRYQYRNGPFAAFTWRYDSGMVAGAAEDPDEILALSGARQAAMGLFCGSQLATPLAPIRECPQALQATRIRIPAPGTADPDHNPPRIAPRHLFNLSAGTDNLFRAERLRTSLKVTVVNLTNRVALYNFLSTFAGTHFVSPRSVFAEVGFHFGFARPPLLTLEVDRVKAGNEAVPGTADRNGPR
jgi:hypothetical protein